MDLMKLTNNLAENLVGILQESLRFFKFLYIHTIEARPLETIPGETAAKTTDRVTSNVPKTKPATAKTPGRVASGKRLAERNRLAREAKKQAEAQNPTTNSTNNTNSNQVTNQNTDQSSTSSNTTNNASAYLILGVGGLIVSALGVYYQREAIMKTLGRSTDTQPTAPTAPLTTSSTVGDDPTPAVIVPKRKYGIRELK